MEHPELKIVLALPHPFQAKESSSDQCNEVHSSASWGVKWQL